MYCFKWGLYRNLIIGLNFFLLVGSRALALGEWPGGAVVPASLGSREALLTLGAAVTQVGPCAGLTALDMYVI